MANHGPLVGKVLLLEGYDIGLVRRLVTGVDVWMNTPVYPEEASGTSGMKAAINGVLNLSVTDGWWVEGYQGDNGWAIRPSPHTEYVDRRDHEDARTLYETLQDQVLPLYYERGKYGYSSDWVKMSKRAMASMMPRFNSSRMVNDYIEKYYSPAAQTGRRLNRNNGAPATALTAWKARIRASWDGVVLEMQQAPVEALQFGSDLSFEVVCDLNGLKPEDVVVELVMRPAPDTGSAPVGGSFTDIESVPLRAQHRAKKTQPLRFEPQHTVDDGRCLFRLCATPEHCGQMGLSVRVYPHHADLVHPFDMGMMRWL